ncbi:MAG: carboxypeptidase regulatory-like domain-containing protein [Candidatus Riflebacteria bacterium]|nr:carboxypeptidase regulatory-like domain-containing protein [Candidatus Riflebacteria bacterium]
MKKNRACLAIIILMALHTATLFARAQTARPSFYPGEVFKTKQFSASMTDGAVWFLNSGGNTWKRVTNGQAFRHGESVRTGNNGYIAIIWQDKAAIFIKPNTAVRLLNPMATADVPAIQIHYGEVLASVLEEGKLDIQTAHFEAAAEFSEVTVAVAENSSRITALAGRTSVIAEGQNPLLVEPGYSLTFTQKEVSSERISLDQEYQSFRRFKNLLERLRVTERRRNKEISFSLESLELNGEYLANMPQEDGLYQIRTPDYTIPKEIILQFRVFPPPPEPYRFEAEINKDLVFPIMELENAIHRVRFATPSIPEFYVKIFVIEESGNRRLLAHIGFSVINKNLATIAANKFIDGFRHAFEKKDLNWLMDNIDPEYRDHMGNSRSDFLKLFEDDLRNYRNITLWMRPFKFEYKNCDIAVHMNYRVSGLSRDFTYRYKDSGSEIFTLRPVNGKYMLHSKIAGMFFNRMRVAIDLRQSVLRGRVVDERNQSPMEGVKVTLQGTSHTAYTNSFGEYIFYNVKPGKYTVNFFKNGYANLTATNVELRPAGEI